MTHTILESMVRPILRDVVSFIFDEIFAQAIVSIYLSNGTVSRRIVDIVRVYYY